MALFLCFLFQPSAKSERLRKTPHAFPLELVCRPSGWDPVLGAARLQTGVPFRHTFCST